MFTDFTNKWKGQAPQAKSLIQSAGAPIGLQDLKRQVREMDAMRKVARVDPQARQFAPRLPMPPSVESDQCRISFVRSKAEVRRGLANI